MLVSASLPVDNDRNLSEALRAANRAGIAVHLFREKIMRQLPSKGMGWAFALLLLVGSQRAAVAADDKEPSYGGKRLSEWVKGLDSEDYSTHEATQSALRKVDGKEMDALTRALKHEDADIRRAAAKCWGASARRLRRQ
jgi:hypothetical protein